MPTSPVLYEIEKTTLELQKGNVLISTYGQSYKGCSISTFGIAHGIVFGDGSCCSNKSQIRLCGNKNKELLKYFNNSTTGENKETGEFYHTRMECIVSRGDLLNLKSYIEALVCLNFDD